MSELDKINSSLDDAEMAKFAEIADELMKAGVTAERSFRLLLGKSPKKIHMDIVGSDVKIDVISEK